MIGDASDMQARLRALLPPRWFADDAPVLGLALAGLAEGWAWLHGLVAQARAQTRIATATDTHLDLISRDLFAAGLPRRFGEADAAFRARIRRALLPPRATRPALVAALEGLTGRTPRVFEPARPADTGAYGHALGYGAAGGWGSLALPFQCFVTAYRPRGVGVPLSGGWGMAAGGYGCGALQYASRAMAQSQVGDAEILATVAGAMPVASIAWTRIAN